MIRGRFWSVSAHSRCYWTAISQYQALATTEAAVIGVKGRCEQNCERAQGAAEIVPIFAGVEVQGLGWMFSRVYYTSKMGVVGVGAQRVSSLQNLVLVLNRACFLIWA